MGVSLLKTVDEIKIWGAKTRRKNKNDIDQCVITEGSKGPELQEDNYRILKLEM